MKIILIIECTKILLRRCMKMSSLYCVICGRSLTNPTSIARGIGPVCYSHKIEELDSRRDRMDDFDTQKNVELNPDFAA